jgi:proprotein convertase subtilisin/kexin type 5
MNGTVCRTCISFIAGCLYCTSTSVCLSCQSGYYQAGNTCVACSGITGCLDCSGPSTCNLCSDAYYLNSGDGLCYICNTTIAGCISCASQTTCKACLGNYALSGGNCTALKSTSSLPY